MRCSGDKKGTKAEEVEEIYSDSLFPSSMIPSLKGARRIEMLLSVQTGDMKRRPGNGIEGAMVCTCLGSLLRPLFYFLDDVSYPQSVVLPKSVAYVFSHDLLTTCAARQCDFIGFLCEIHGTSQQCDIIPCARTYFLPFGDGFWCGVNLHPIWRRPTINHLMGLLAVSRPSPLPPLILSYRGALLLLLLLLLFSRLT